MAKDKTIYVYADWEGLTEPPVLMGVLTAIYSRGKEIFSFEYDHSWLENGNAHQLDPDLRFYHGRQFNGDEKPNFGLFLDSSPDRWGRVLMKRREAILARQEGRKPLTLFESDFLLGVYDEHRMGGLRFKEQANGAFVNTDKNFATPPWTSLRELEQASLELEKDDYEDREALKWINMLLAPGSSLGGARPKASVRDEKGRLWIAKFPSGGDEWDIGGWEAVALQIAQKAGIKASTFIARKFSGKHHCFLSQRFDRTITGNRIHFASAMTLLGHRDGTDHSSGASYLELAEFIIQQGSAVNEDLEELWRRIVLNICIRNTDDHLRNHGFLLTDHGWTLSPVYDVNPYPEGTGLTLNISEDDNSLDLEVALSVSGFFRVQLPQAHKIIKQVEKTVGQWSNIATEIGLPKRERDLMEPAFMLNN